MRSTSTILFLLFLTFYSFIIQAREVAGINVAESVQVGGTDLVLNGSGIRTKYFFKVYVGSLYSKDRVDSLQGVIDQQGPYRISMHILYGEIDGKKLNATWAEGFKNNLAMDEITALQPSFDAFYSLFKTVYKGDVINIDIDNQKRTSVYYNSIKQGEIVNPIFPSALLKIWLGHSPADPGLKTAMLNGS